MATTEHIGLMTTKDSNGNTNLLYPITKAEAVDGLDEAIGNGTITITQNGTTKGTFTTNQSGNTTIELTDTNTDTDTWRGIQDNLTSTSTTDSLSANQGRVLKGLVDGKAPSSHAHNYAGSDYSGGPANSANWLNYDSSLTYGASGLQYFNHCPAATSGAAENASPIANVWYHMLRMNHNNSAGYFADIAVPLTGDTNDVCWRRICAGSETTWRAFLDSNNYTTYCTPYNIGAATVNHTHNYADIDWRDSWKVGPLTYNNLFEITSKSNADDGIHLMDSNGWSLLRPNADSRTYLGYPENRWAEFYAVNSTISTSDRNEKYDISYIGEESEFDTETSDELLTSLIMGMNPVVFKRTNGESGRPHHGMISQDIEELLKSLGIDHAGFIKSPVTKQIEVYEVDGEEVFRRDLNTDTTDEIPEELEAILKEYGDAINKRVETEVVEGEYKYGLRYEEFIGDIIRFCQLLKNENDALKQENIELRQEIQDIKADIQSLKNA